MYVLMLSLLMVISLALTFRVNGIGSFITLGIIGAAIYTVPAIIDTQLSFASTGTASQLHYIEVPTYVDLVVVWAWTGLLLGLISSTILFPQSITQKFEVDERVMKSLARATAIIATLGILYLALSSESILFFLQQRKNQDSGVVSTLWKWTGVLGLLAATLGRDRKLIYFHALVIVIIFLRGDRTLVAIVTAALIATASHQNPKWYTRLKLSQIAGFIFAVLVIFLGKSIYFSVKSAAAGSNKSIDMSLKQQLLMQFEPIATFSHIQFVIVSGVTITPGEFLQSVIGNILMVPSAFGVSTNLYNDVVTSALSPNVGFGVAGNYLAHGYTVGGTLGASLFYFMLPLMLRLCDGQFRSKTGSIKVFWCCVGAVFAFYIHRNGLDNLFSFVRQIFIVSVATAGLAAAMRHLGLVAAPIGTRRALIAGGAVPATGFDLAPRNPPPAPDPRGRPVA